MEQPWGVCPLQASLFRRGVQFANRNRVSRFVPKLVSVYRVIAMRDGFGPVSTGPSVCGIMSHSKADLLTI